MSSSVPWVELDAYAALLAAVDRDPVVVFEVGPELLAPPLRVGDAVLFRRMTQLGWAGGMCLGPADDVARLLAGPWRTHPAWAAERSMTVRAECQDALAALGARAVGEWSWLFVVPDEVCRRPLPDGVSVEAGLPRAHAAAFVDVEYTTRWLPPETDGEVWVALRDERGTVLGTGLAAYTPTGAIRLSSITIAAAQRGRGLGRALTQALVDVGTDAPAVVLGVDCDNPTAAALYAAMGFRRVHDLVSGSLQPA